jgi:agmatinase
VKEFFDLPQSTPEVADILVLSFPFEGSVSYGAGTGGGPEAVREASLHLEEWEEETQLDLGECLRIAALDPLEPTEGESSDEYARRTREFCANLSRGDRFVLGLGGEHSITPNLLAGAYADLNGFTVVQIDAHADLRDSYNGSRHNHACAMRRALDLEGVRLEAIAIRSSTREEAELSRTDPRIHTWWAHELSKPGVFEQLLARLRSVRGPVFLTVDVDGLDVTLCPGTGTPQPGGLSYTQTLDVLRALILEGDCTLVGADFMETTPQPGSRVNEMVVAKLCQKILAYRIARQRS